MKKQFLPSRGFTLIELLVVVLIIGILAAVALPQYQAAVAKARFSSVLPLMRTIKEAQERYYLANGAYARWFEELDVDIPSSCVVYKTYKNMYYCGDWFIDNVWGYNQPDGILLMTYCPNTAERETDFTACSGNAHLLLRWYYDFADNTTQRGKIHCEWKDELGKKLCKTFKF